MRFPLLIVFQSGVVYPGADSGRSETLPGTAGRLAVDFGWSGFRGSLFSPSSRLCASLRGVSCSTSLSQWSTHPVTAAVPAAAAAARTGAAIATVSRTGAGAAAAAQCWAPVRSRSSRTRGWGRCQPL